MSARVRLELTKAEADAMMHALGNTTEHDDAMEAVFPDAVERAACRRAERKLARGIYGAWCDHQSKREEASRAADR